MANYVKFKQGLKKDFNTTNQPLTNGMIYFVIDENNNGSIYYDTIVDGKKATKNGTVHRVKFSGLPIKITGSVIGTGVISQDGETIEINTSTNHSHGLVHQDFTVRLSNDDTNLKWTRLGNQNSGGFWLKSIRGHAKAPAWFLSDYSAGIAFGGEDTKGIISVKYSQPGVRFAGGNGDAPVWYFTITGSNNKSYDLNGIGGHSSDSAKLDHNVTFKIASTADATNGANGTKTDLSGPAVNLYLPTKISGFDLLQASRFQGNADSATYATSAGYAKGLSLNPETRQEDMNFNLADAKYIKRVTYSMATSTTKKNKPPIGDANILSFGWDNSGYGSQLAIQSGSAGHLAVRGSDSNNGASSWGEWSTVLDSSNYTSYINNYYWANVKVSTTSSTETKPTFNTAYTSNWWRSTGKTGWWNDTYSGGIAMEDKIYVKVAGNKSFLIPNGSLKIGGNGDIFFATGYDDATLKIYGQTNTDFGIETIVIQTCFDNRDPQTSEYTTQYANRCNLLLQPRGGQVYIGKNLTTPGDTGYKLFVDGKTWLRDALYIGSDTNGKNKNYIAFYGTYDDGEGYFNHTYIGENVFSTSGKSSELVLFKGNDQGSNDTVESITGSGPDRIRHIAAGHLFQVYRTSLSGSFSDVCASTTPSTVLEVNGGGLSVHGQKTTFTTTNSSGSSISSIGSVVRIYGNTYGNDANYLISKTAGVFSYGDGGPQIRFGTNYAGNQQEGALIYTDHDSAGTGVSWHFVSNQPDWSVDSKRYVARTSVTIGNLLPNTSYALYVGGGEAYYTNHINMKQNASILFSNPSQFFRWSASTTDLNSTKCNWYGIGSYNHGEGNSQTWLNISNYWGINITTRDNTYLQHNGRVLTNSGNATGTVGSATKPVYSNQGVLTPITSYEGNAATATNAAHADTLDGYHADAFVKKAGDTMTGHLKNNSEFITTSLNGFRISAASSTNTKSMLLRNDGSDFYILCCNSTTAGDNWYIPTGGAHPLRINLTTGYSYFSKVYGAVWNDYAEYRSTPKVKPGQCVIETGKGDLIKSSKRLQPGANIVSDTFGFAIGETEQTKTPLAVSGRVLAYPYEDRDSYQAGDPVCSGPNGTISKMTREEVREYPDRIIGTVSEIPDYEVWGTGNVKVNNRIWIKVK